MNVRQKWYAVALTGLVLCASIILRADETANKARAVFEANKQAVVTVSLVIGVSFGGMERENEMESNGTVITPEGLTVLALSAMDPFAVLESFQDEDHKMVSKVKSLKIILADGSELPAEVVLRDKTLDLALLRPQVKPEKPMVFVNLESPGKVQVMDEFVVLGQLGKVTRRAHSVFVDRIEAVVDKPRLFYVPGQHRMQAIMCSPAFTLDGKFIGVGVMRTIKGGSDMGFGMGMMGMGGDATVILVPAEDIQEMVKQAPPYGAPLPADTTEESTGE